MACLNQPAKSFFPLEEKLNGKEKNGCPSQAKNNPDSVCFHPPLGGCTYSNLDERPLEVSLVVLNKGHSLAQSYPEENFIHLIVSGEGNSFVEAHKKGADNAYSKYAQMIQTKVTNLYLQHVKMASSEYREEITKNVETFLSLSTRDILLVGIKEIFSWNGYEGGKKYCFSRYVLNKKISGESIQKQAQKIYREIVAIQNRLKDKEMERGERERLALEGLRKIFELDVLEGQCLYFGKSISVDFSPMKILCTETISLAGKRKEKAPEARNLEELNQSFREALKFYQEAFKYRPDRPFLEENVKRLKKQIACPQCQKTLGEVSQQHWKLRSREKQLKENLDPDETRRLSLEVLGIIMELRKKVRCENCKFFQISRSHKLLKDFNSLEDGCVIRIYQYGRELEQRGDPESLEEALKIYSRIREYRPRDSQAASYILRVKRRLPCKKCNFSGKCDLCQGQKGEWSQCSQCQGQGRYTRQCSTCKGSGQSKCSTCNGYGRIQTACQYCQGGWINCTTCQGKGGILAYCATCRGRGRLRCVYGRCQYCRFSGIVYCSVCRGSGKILQRCSTCGGKGKGVCPYCRGVASSSQQCSTCGGQGRSGLCGTCQGQGRMSSACTTCGGRGQVWKICSRCFGKGTCAVCGGQGHRP